MFLTIVTCAQGAGRKAPRHSPPLSMRPHVLPVVGQCTWIEHRSMYCLCLRQCACMCTPGSWSVWQWQVLKPVYAPTRLALPHLPCSPAQCLPRTRAARPPKATDHWAAPLTSWKGGHGIRSGLVIYTQQHSLYGLAGLSL